MISKKNFKKGTCLAIAASIVVISTQCYNNKKIKELDAKIKCVEAENKSYKNTFNNILIKDENIIKLLKDENKASKDKIDNINKQLDKIGLKSSDF